MQPPVLRAVIIGTLEDWDVDEVLDAERLDGLIEALAESWLKDRGRAVATVSEEIARAIEVANGDRCPECDGESASSKWAKPRPGPVVKVGRCGAGHAWEVRSGHWVDPAQVARDHATPNCGSSASEVGRG